MVKQLNLGNNLVNDSHLDLLKLGKLDHWAKPFGLTYTMLNSMGIYSHNSHFFQCA